MGPSQGSSASRYGAHRLKGDVEPLGGKPIDHLPEAGLSPVHRRIGMLHQIRICVIDKIPQDVQLYLLDSGAHLNRRDYLDRMVSRGLERILDTCHGVMIGDSDHVELGLDRGAHHGGRVKSSV
jgi:hypothetical protein